MRQKTRIALTIVYNGAHHLTDEFVKFMTDTFTLWVIVEGQSRNGGSTSWCKHVEAPFNSKDGTIERIEQIQSNHKNVLTYVPVKHYKSKDEQVNRAIELIKTRFSSGFLWQVDVDEHWTKEDIEAAERSLWRSPESCAEFQFNHYVKKDVVAIGRWGSGYVTRLWKWSGHSFISHEPAILAGQTNPIKLPQKFQHYSMIYPQDVKWKAKSYKGHEMVYINWLKLDEFTYPQHISNLFGKNNVIGRSDTWLHKIKDQSCVNALNQDAPKNNVDNPNYRKHHRRRSVYHAQTSTAIPGQQGGN